MTRATGACPSPHRYAPLALLRRLRDHRQRAGFHRLLPGPESRWVTPPVLNSVCKATQASGRLLCCCLLQISCRQTKLPFNLQSLCRQGVQAACRAGCLGPARPPAHRSRHGAVPLRSRLLPGELEAVPTCCGRCARGASGRHSAGRAQRAGGHRAAGGWEGCGGRGAVWVGRVKQCGRELHWVWGTQVISMAGKTAAAVSHSAFSSATCHAISGVHLCHAPQPALLEPAGGLHPGALCGGDARGSRGGAEGWRLSSRQLPPAMHAWTLLCHRELARVCDGMQRASCCWSLLPPHFHFSSPPCVRPVAGHAGRVHAIWRGGAQVHRLPGAWHHLMS